MKLTNIRYIVPAVENIRARTSSSGFQRTAPKLSYAKANQRWWIKLRFTSDIDLIILEKAVTGSEIRLVELDGSFYLEDRRIPDTASMGEARRLAEILVPQLNGAIQFLCWPFQTATFECLIEVLENGTGRGIATCAFAVHGTSDYPDIASFLKGDPAPIRSLLPLWKTDQDIQDALYYIGAEGNQWANLYRAAEVVEDSVGGESMILERGWCSRSSWTRFRRTANHQEAIGLFSRHARATTQAPSNPMTLSEARVFVAGLVRSWILFMMSRDASLETVAPQVAGGVPIYHHLGDSD